GNRRTNDGDRRRSRTRANVSRANALRRCSAHLARRRKQWQPDRRRWTGRRSVAANSDGPQEKGPVPFAESCALASGSRAQLKNAGSLRPPLIAALSKCKLETCVFNVVVSFLKSVARFCFDIQLRLQQAEGAVQWHGFSAGRTRARIGNTLGLHARHIPF